MQLKLTIKYIISFISLTFVLHEAHEIAHTLTGRLICGCWGQRDFNGWGTCDGCNSCLLNYINPTFMGPLFTFIIIWIGALFLGKYKSIEQKSIGFSLIFASMPFARIFNPIFGGGDEVMVLDSFINNWDLSRILILIMILCITAYPLYKAFISMNNKYRIGIFILFLFAPVIIDFALVLGLLNYLLGLGFLSRYWILGSPIIVTVWTILVTCIFIFTRKNIYTLFKES